MVFDLVNMSLIHCTLGHFSRGQFWLQDKPKLIFLAAIDYCFNGCVVSTFYVCKLNKNCFVPNTINSEKNLQDLEVCRMTLGDTLLFLRMYVLMANDL